MAKENTLVFQNHSAMSFFAFAREVGMVPVKKLEPRPSAMSDGIEENISGITPGGCL